MGRPAIDDPSLRAFPNVPRRLRLHSVVTPDIVVNDHPVTERQRSTCDHLHWFVEEESSIDKGS
jgi:hypothetical protein